MESNDGVIEEITGELKSIGGKFDREVRALRSDFATVRTLAEDAAAGRDKRYDELEQYVATLEAAMKRSPIGDGIERKVASPYDKAAEAYLRRGKEVLEPHEVKELSVGTDPAGGYLASSSIYNTVLARLREISPVRQIARSVGVGKGELQVPRRERGITAQWVGEREERPTTDMSFGQVNILPQELAAVVEVTTKLLEDMDYDVEQMIGEEFADQFAESEGAAFVKGNGVKKPSGFLTYPEGSGMSQVAQLPSGNATQLTPDSMITALYSLKAGYRANAVWVMNGTTLAAVRSMKDAAGRYLWDASNGGLVSGQPETILGKRVYELPDMPNVAAGAMPIAVGDFRRAYMVVDRRGVAILRDPFTKGHQGLVRMIGSLRVGGELVLGEAMKIVKISA